MVRRKLEGKMGGLGREGMEDGGERKEARERGGEEGGRGKEEVEDYYYYSVEKYPQYRKRNISAKVKI